MGRASLHPAPLRMRLTWIVWGLASLLCLFTVENIWIDPWLRHNSRRIPSRARGIKRSLVFSLCNQCFHTRALKKCIKFCCFVTATLTLARR
jgi:hypothetical protein